MEIKKSFDVDVYCCKVVVVVTDNMEATMKKYLKKFKLPYEEGSVYEGLFISDTTSESSSYYILFNKNSLSINTIAHESYHACARILKDRGVDISSDNEEPVAYLMGYVVQSVINVIVSQKLNLSHGAK